MKILYYVGIALFVPFGLVILLLLFIFRRTAYELGSEEDYKEAK